MYSSSPRRFSTLTISELYSALSARPGSAHSSAE
jgi:hypothetical protein